MLKSIRAIVVPMFVALLFLAAAGSTAQSKQEMKMDEGPLRVVLAGLAHGHAFGFFDQFQKRTDLQVVGIAEADGQLVAQFEKKYGLAPGIFYPDLEELLKKTHPQAVLAYTNTYDHRRGVEVCAPHGVPGWMGKTPPGSPANARGVGKKTRPGENPGVVDF